MYKLDRKKLSAERTVTIIETVQNDVGRIFRLDDVRKVIELAGRKCEMNGKDEEYFYLLLEDELRWHMVRAFINENSSSSKVQFAPTT